MIHEIQLLLFSFSLPDAQHYKKMLSAPAVKCIPIKGSLMNTPPLYIKNRPMLCSSIIPRSEEPIQKMENKTS